MFTKHFLKVLTLFLGIIIFGLIGIFLVSYFSEEVDQPIDTNNQRQVAE
ncbi:MAG: hypothetical protein WCP17_03385 [bacterium]